MNGNVSGEGSPPMQAHLNHGPLGEQGRTCFPARGMSIMVSGSYNTIRTGVCDIARVE